MRGWEKCTIALCRAQDNIVFYLVTEYTKDAPSSGDLCVNH
jgi:hypothetical protein